MFGFQPVWVQPIAPWYEKGSVAHNTQGGGVGVRWSAGQVVGVGANQVPPPPTFQKFVSHLRGIFFCKNIGLSFLQKKLFSTYRQSITHPHEPNERRRHG